jgi:hypothetical protein
VKILLPWVKVTTNQADCSDGPPERLVLAGGFCNAALQGGMQDIKLDGSASPQQLVVIGVGADPEPDDTVFAGSSEGPMAPTDSDGPELANLLQVKRRMLGVGFQKSKVFIGEGADGLRKAPVMTPETW